MNYDELSIEELERCHQQLKYSVLQASTAIKTNRAISKLREALSHLPADGVEQELAETQQRGVEKLRHQLHEASSKHSLQQSFLTALSMSRTAHDVLLSAPTNSGPTPASGVEANSPGQPVDVAPVAEGCGTPIAQEMGALAAEQVQLSEHLVRRSAEIQQLQHQCWDLQDKVMLNGHASEQRQRQQACRLHSDEGKALEDARVEKVMADASNDDIKVARDKLHRYKCRKIILQHILQCLIHSCDLEHSELCKWWDALAACADPPSDCPPSVQSHCTT